MTTFDDRLAHRLARLEAAAPAPKFAPRADALQRPTARAGAVALPRWRRRIFVVLAAIALFAVGTIAMAQGLSRPETPDTAVDAALAGVFRDSDCVPARVAKPAIESRIAELGRTGWTIEARPGAESATCVAAVAFSDTQMILLLPAAGEEVSRAMQAVAADLLARCLDREQATAYVRGVLDNLGLAATTIRVDPSAHTGPIESIDEYERHVAAGCYVYAGYQHDADGKPFVVLWGQ